MNRLASASSSYLQSAAHQPIDWYEWGDEAFAQAQKLNRPILLDIGAVWCHWCHVIDHESYEDPEIAQMINELYIPIKVDRDERPDIDRRYQTAVGAITGSGGWPLTAFLTPKGKLFYGGTYFPPEDRGPYPGFKTLLPQIAELYQQERDRVIANADQLHEQIAGMEERSISSAALTPSITEQVLQRIKDRFDESYGGFEAQPKFPHPGVIELLLDLHYLEGDPRLLQMVTRTLDGMAQGGIYDQLGGGFHRYSVDRFWRVPHFEKLLYDNAELLKNYLHAYQATQNPFYREIAEGIIRYTDQNLSDREHGGFYASQDADSGPNDEGGYYTWTLEEVNHLLTPDEAAAIRIHYDVHERGEMDHDTRQNILWVAKSIDEVARELGKPLEETQELIRQGKQKLLEAREKRNAPFIDRNLFTNWNAMMISAYLQAYRILGLESTRDFALKTLDLLIEHVYREGASPYHFSKDSKAEVTGLLDDMVQLSAALLDAFEINSEHHYLATAVDLMEYALTSLWDEQNDGFFDVEPRHEASEVLETRQKPFEDAPMPGGNALAAIVLDRLFYLTHDGRYRERAEATLAAFGGTAGAYGTMAATYALAVLRHLNPPPAAVIIGRAEDSKTWQLRDAAERIYRPGKEIAVFDPEDKDLPYPPGPGGEPIAYVCAGMTCGPPVDEPDELEDMVESVGVTSY